MKNITPILLVIFILLTAYNTYKIHTINIPVQGEVIEIDSNVNEKINANATEIQNLKINIETIVNFMNSKFESLQGKEVSE